MMNIRQLFCIAIAAVCFSACDDTTDTLGNSLTNDVDKFDIIPDTFNVTTKSIIIDSVLSSSQYSYLGHIKDPETKTYVTSNYTTQFAVLESFDDSKLLPEQDSIVSRNEHNAIIADSCKLNIYFYSSIGDSLNPMRLTVHEMAQPIKEGIPYYTNYNPETAGLLRTDANAIKKSKTYTPVDLNLSDSVRYKIVDKTNMESVSIPLNEPYIDAAGNQYENYGTYIMRKYFDNPDDFKNSYNFIHNVCPGFYIKSTDGLGVMSEVYLTELALYYKYLNDSTYNGTLLLSGTEEVMQTTNIVNDRKTIDRLAADNTCTYIKAPAGIFTEVTIPVEEIKLNHEKDTISSAKIVFNAMNDATDEDYAFGKPQNLLMVHKDSLYEFFERKELPNYKTSFVASYNSSYNTYTFNNISTLISAMYEARMSGKASEDWNKVVLVPISITRNSSSTASSVTNVSNEMSLKSTRLVGGKDNPRNPIKISVIYNRFIKE
jgi:hypothetical protein